MRTLNALTLAPSDRNTTPPTSMSPRKTSIDS